MAHMNQERKARIAASLKGIIPKDWKYSLSVHRHSTICLTIRSAPVNLIAERAAVVNKCRQPQDFADPTAGHGAINDYCLDGQFEGALLETLQAIVKALHEGNHDRSDLQSDYHDVGWYVDISIGRWDKPFVCTAAVAA